MENSTPSESTLQDCFDHADWDMFRVASENNIDVNADSVSEFIRKCIGDVVPTVTIKTYPKQKPWIDGGIRAKLKANSIVIPSARQSNKQNVSRETKWRRKSKLRHETNVAGSRTTKENQPDHGHRRLASRQTKHLLCFENNTVPTRPLLWALFLRG
jgi:hypothetical protein